MPFPSPGDLPDSGIEPRSPALTGGLFTTQPPGKSIVHVEAASDTGRWGQQGSRICRMLWEFRTEYPAQLVIPGGIPGEEPFIQRQAGFPAQRHTGVPAGWGPWHTSGGDLGWGVWAALIRVVMADLAVSTSPLDAFSCLDLVLKGLRKPLVGWGTSHRQYPCLPARPSSFRAGILEGSPSCSLR